MPTSSRHRSLQFLRTLCNSLTPHPPWQTDGRDLGAPARLAPRPRHAPSAAPDAPASPPADDAGGPCENLPVALRQASRASGARPLLLCADRASFVRSILPMVKAQVSSQIKVRDLSRCTVTASPAQFSSWNEARSELMIEAKKPLKVGVCPRFQAFCNFARNLTHPTFLLHDRPSSPASSPSPPTRRSARASAPNSRRASACWSTRYCAAHLHFASRPLSCRPSRSFPRQVDHTPRELAMSLSVAYNFLSK